MEKGLTWPKFKSAYAKQHPGSSTANVSSAWLNYKNEHGIKKSSKPKKSPKAKKSSKASSSKKAASNKKKKIVRATQEYKLVGKTLTITYPIELWVHQDGVAKQHTGTFSISKFSKAQTDIITAELMRISSESYTIKSIVVDRLHALLKITLTLVPSVATERDARIIVERIGKIIDSYFGDTYVKENPISAIKGINLEHGFRLYIITAPVQ